MNYRWQEDSLPAVAQVFVGFVVGQLSDSECLQALIPMVNAMKLLQDSMLYILPKHYKPISALASYDSR